MSLSQDRFDQGIDPREERGAQVALREALEQHIRSMEKRECSPRSIECLRYRIEHYAAKLLDRSLSSITRPECVALHDEVSKRSPYAGNHVIVHLTTLWNSARKLYPELPVEPPTIAVTKNKQRRWQEPISWDDLPEWWTKVEGIANPVRRDGQLVVTHVREVKEQRYQDGRKVPYLPSPHRMRDTFATAGHEARIHPMDLKILMNHALPSGNVTEGYIRPSGGHLHESVERIADLLLEKAGLAEYPSTLTSARNSAG